MRAQVLERATPIGDGPLQLVEREPPEPAKPKSFGWTFRASA